MQAAFLIASNITGEYIFELCSSEKGMHEELSKDKIYSSFLKKKAREGYTPGALFVKPWEFHWDSSKTPLTVSAAGKCLTYTGEDIHWNVALGREDIPDNTKTSWEIHLT